MSQSQAEPKPLGVKAAPEGALLKLERALNPGESGAPLLSPEGKVLALCGGLTECIPIEMARKLIQ
jgi:hypothetical protein